MSRFSKASSDRFQLAHLLDEESQQSLALRIVSGYRFIVELDETYGFVGRMIEMPGVVAEGKSADECIEKLRTQALDEVARIVREGQRPPVAGRRSEQVNIRLTPLEKMLVEDAAYQQGCTLSDFLRGVALERSWTEARPRRSAE